MKPVKLSLRNPRSTYSSWLSCLSHVVSSLPSVPNVWHIKIKFGSLRVGKNRFTIEWVDNGSPWSCCWWCWPPQVLLSILVLLSARLLRCIRLRRDNVKHHGYRTLTRSVTWESSSWDDLFRKSFDGDDISVTMYVTTSSPSVHTSPVTYVITSAKIRESQGSKRWQFVYIENTSARLFRIVSWFELLYQSRK
jgi:hypothetical protein